MTEAQAYAVLPLAGQPEHYFRPMLPFPNARTAFKAFLKAVPFAEGETVLLPAYIGWSPREGSGVFDPVTQLDLPFRFYRVDDNLHIDLDDLRRRFHESAVRVLVLIHYFGYVDPAYSDAIQIARAHNALVLEDEAHAMFSDLVGGVCGRLGDACIFSLHKLLPLKTGGMLVVNQKCGVALNRILDAAGRADVRRTVSQGQQPSGESAETDPPSPWEYDLSSIFQRRRENAAQLDALLEPLRGEIDPLWGLPRPGEAPQTYPVRVRNVSRDELYFAMNRAGFGAVSLYHTLVTSITCEAFPAAHALSRCIFNLPVHQDLDGNMLMALVDKLAECISSLSSVS